MRKLNKKNIMILIILIILSIVGLKAFNKSRANKTLEIIAKFNDIEGLVDDEKSTLLATNENENGMAITLPEFVNDKKINKYIITKKDISDENNLNIPNTESTESANQTENTESTNQTESTESIKQTESTENMEKTQNTENKNETIEKLPGEKIYLTQEEIEKLEITLAIYYDKIEIEQQILYNKKISYKDENNSELISISGYMPQNTQIEVNSINISELEKEISENYPNNTIVRKL